MRRDGAYGRYKQLREMVGFGEQDVQNLRDVRPLLVQEGGRLTDTFYKVLLADPETAALLGPRVDQLKKTHAAWLLSLCEGGYDQDFFDRQFRIGVVHVEQGIPPWFVSGVMSIVRVEAARLFAQQLEKQAEETTASFLKIVDLVSLVIDMGYAEARLSRIAMVTRMSPELIIDLIENSGAERPEMGFF